MIGKDYFVSKNIKKCNSHILILQKNCVFQVIFVQYSVGGLQLKAAFHIVTIYSDNKLIFLKKFHILF